MFTISRNSLPMIQTYDQAVKFWENAKPQDGLYRALGRKRDTSKRVWSPDEGKSIYFRFHHTDLVKYHAPDQVEITAWDSVSSSIFVNELTPYGISMYSIRGVMRINKMVPRESSIRFTFVDDQWRPNLEDVRQEYRLVPDYKIAARVRKQLEPFRKYQLARAALEGGLIRIYPILNHRLPSLSEFANPERWPLLYDQLRAVAFESVRRALIVEQGGVKEEPLPPGEIPLKSVFDPFV